MNIENFKAVRDAIADEANYFDMSVFGFVPNDDPKVEGVPVCGTASCIAGWGAFLMNGGENQLSDAEYNNSDISTREWFGISRAQADYIFYGDWRFAGGGLAATRKEAIDYLDNVIKTGDVYCQ